ncbi:MAG: hypothetical protein ABII00_13035 [Elusimicrobiota bacterium]
MAYTPERLTEELKAIYKENLECVLLYGSGADGDYVEKYSDFNVLVILKRLDLGELKRMSRTVRDWVKAGNPPPLMFTLERFRRSEDVFPIEFLDMRDRHKVLHGRDPFVGLEIHPTNLRQQLEFELKGKLIKLRESYLLAGEDPGELRALLVKASSTFLILFLGALRLFGHEPLPPKAEAAKALASRVGFDPEVFYALRGLRDGDPAAEAADPDELMERLLAAVEAAVDAVDQWKPEK